MNSEPSLPPDPVDVDEAARIMGIQPRTLYRDRYTNERYPRAYEVGRSLFWSRRECEEYRREHPGRSR